MYRQTGAGKIPLAPARLARLTLLQVYSGEADHEAVELTVDSQRWQMVLDCLGEKRRCVARRPCMIFACA